MSARTMGSGISVAVHLFSERGDETRSRLRLDTAGRDPNDTDAFGAYLF